MLHVELTVEVPLLFILLTADKRSLPKPNPKRFDYNMERPQTVKLKPAPV